jgi:hypothetical protein
MFVFQSIIFPFSFGIKFHVPVSSGSLMVSTKQKLKTDLIQPPFLCFKIYKIITSINLGYLSETCYHTPFQDPLLSSSSVGRNSQVHGFSVVLLPIEVNYEVRVASNGVMAIPSFINI